MSKLAVKGHTSGTGTVTLEAPNTSTNRTITLPDKAGTTLVDESNGTNGIDSSGNMGLGVTPESGWGSGSWKAFQIAEGALWGLPNTGHIYLSSNVYDDGSSPKRLISGAASGYFQPANGTHGFRVASSSTADSAITWTTGFEVLNDGKARATNGLLFGTDTAAANALDDYEEGTWTPTVVQGASSLSITTANYTKIGRQVTIQFHITISSGNASELRIGGLPFTVKSGNYCTGVLDSISGTADNTPFIRSEGSNTYLRCFYSDRSSYTGSLAVGSQIGSVTYMT